MQLYKFIPISPRAIVTLATGKFWAASLDKMNDPFEDRFTDSNSKMLINNCGVLSFSGYNTKNGNILQEPLMWAHYAKNHEGIAIGLKPKNENSQFFKVEYLSHEDLDKKFTELISNHKGKSGQVISPWQEIFFKYKTNFWNYENEYRQVQILASNMYVNPYANINEIVFGFRTKPEEEIAIWSALKDKVNYKKVHNRNGALEVEDYTPPKEIETTNNLLMPVSIIGAKADKYESAKPEDLKLGKNTFK